MNFDYDFYNLVLSEVSTRIASDQIIIESKIDSDEVSASPDLKKIIRRNRINILLLSEFIYIGRNFQDSSMGTTNIIEAIKISESTYNESNVKILINRAKPLIDVMGDKKIVSSLIKIILALVILEDSNLKKINISIRRRGDYATLKIDGGKVVNHDLFLKDSASLASILFNSFGAKLRISKQNEKRLVFLRMHLSNQMPLQYNK
jgi:hypothetical protein